MSASSKLHHNGEQRIINRSVELDDQALWLRFKSGNDLAFSILYKKYVQRLYNYGMNTCRDHDLVMDVLQDLFARLWDKRTELADVEAVNYYLFKSFRRLLLSKLIEKRKQPMQSINDQTEGFEVLLSLEDSIILHETSTVQAQHLKKAIEALTKRQREAIFLKFYNNLTYQNVASIMEMSVDSTYNIISKAIDILRRSLKGVYFLIPFVESLLS